MGGNRFALLPQFCRLDASFGHVLINRGGRAFDYLSPKKSGVEVRGEIRDIIPLRLQQTSCVMILQNNEAPVLYRVAEQKQVLVAKRK
jgi:hypothetical protein